MSKALNNSEGRVRTGDQKLPAMYGNQEFTGTPDRYDFSYPYLRVSKEIM